ncbi:hypothetical protein CRI77_11625 [Mycolicibacterium duvalii]|uniref:Uncharacterized protein n=1 Tax=Mycolicibacterium duvalii TaxID=39688 RepID=A0A7I7JYU0_9MYCO|nr:hypothetical protein [Mycolicibacterium duvalii]MCV7370808.1 hypothetical protein [Mycolicibacterium duvalii]PEG41370.1 hypothetical protein CRI77_11625 [Mycolicibacterium duvalii]BBX17056.1 hypothetical protein MDUV_19160 [Mycolicibacterium duvalii]
MSAAETPGDEVIEHDPVAEENDLLTTLEANARVRELVRDIRREIAELSAGGAGDLELAQLYEKLAQAEAALSRYPSG